MPVTKSDLKSLFFFGLLKLNASVFFHKFYSSNPLLKLVEL